jgi:hypothetical protein
MLEPCVGKAAIRKELECRMAAKNQFKIIGNTCLATSR